MCIRDRVSTQSTGKRRRSTMNLIRLAITLCISSVAARAPIPSISLHDGPQNLEIQMPAVGLGTGGWGLPDGTDGEAWNDDVSYAATKQWLELGGRRIDCSPDYYDQRGVGRALKEWLSEWPEVGREGVFLTSKVGFRFPMGYNETMKLADLILQELQTPYVDLLLVHWPGPDGNDPNGTASTDWPCYVESGSNDFKLCRQQTWRAMQQLVADQKVRAIGVSNFAERHLLDIAAVGGMQPAVNQVEHHLYYHQDELVQYCKGKNITYNSWAPLGTPDRMSFHTDQWDVLLPEHPTVLAIASAHGCSAAQVMLRWAYQGGVVTNARTQRSDHMAENLAIFGFELSDQEMKTLSSLEPPNPGPAKEGPDPNTIP
eukprot:TRINITY_DN9482_c0_g1_i1.p1 TRINITY_DN9482_c0_g1~~TRINITY_DN9482_c0_g1_i1.p1  ORF type:complete len:372 (-),score=46.80 TRINITY_DN9482_c0_g1_i1:133-1248(-)